MVIICNLHLCKEVGSSYDLEYVICQYNPWIIKSYYNKCLSKYFIDVYSYLTFITFNNKHFESLLVQFTRRCILYLIQQYRKVYFCFNIKFYLSTRLISNHFHLSYRIAYFMYFMSFRCDLVFSYSATQHVW